MKLKHNDNVLTLSQLYHIMLNHDCQHWLIVLNTLKHSLSLFIQVYPGVSYLRQICHTRVHYEEKAFI